MNSPDLHFLPAGANAKLRYQITSGNTMGTFDVEPEVGTIFVAQPLDYEMEQRYELRLVASDGKWENETLVVVQVVNRNDEAPVFSQTEYHAAVTEELTQLPVFILEVSFYLSISAFPCRLDDCHCPSAPAPGENLFID